MCYRLGVTRQENTPAIRAATVQPLVVRRYIDFQRTSSAICR
jgi:hypothetical protein